MKNFKSTFDFNGLLRKIDDYGFQRFKQGESIPCSDEQYDRMVDAMRLYDEIQEQLLKIDSEIVKNI